MARNYDENQLEEDDKSENINQSATDDEKAYRTK